MNACGIYQNDKAVCEHFGLCCESIAFGYCSFEIREGGAGRFEGRVIKFLTSFLGGLIFITPVLESYEFSNIKLVGFVLPNILHRNSSKPPPYFLLMEVIMIFQSCMLDRSMAD